MIVVHPYDFVFFWNYTMLDFAYWFLVFLLRMIHLLSYPGKGMFIGFLTQCDNLIILNHRKQSLFETQLATQYSLLILRQTSCLQAGTTILEPTAAGGSVIVVAYDYHLLMIWGRILSCSMLSLLAELVCCGLIAALRGVLLHSCSSNGSLQDACLIFRWSCRALILLVATHHGGLVGLGRVSLLCEISRQQSIFAFLLVEHAASDVLESLLDLALPRQLTLAKCHTVVVVAARHHLALRDLLVHDLLYYLCFVVLRTVALLDRFLARIKCALLGHTLRVYAPLRPFASRFAGITCL